VEANPLSKRREQLGLTQQEIADRFSPRMTAQAVCAWERGIAAPSRKLVDQIAAAYEITPDAALAARTRIKATALRWRKQRALAMAK